MYQTLYDSDVGIGERCAALIERCAPRLMVSGGGGVAGLWRDRSPVLTEEKKAAIRAAWVAACGDHGPRTTDHRPSSREVLEAIAERYDVHYQTVCRITRELRG